MFTKHDGRLSDGRTLFQLQRKIAFIIIVTGAALHGIQYMTALIGGGPPSIWWESVIVAGALLLFLLSAFINLPVFRFLQGAVMLFFGAYTLIFQECRFKGNSLCLFGTVVFYAYGFFARYTRMKIIAALLFMAGINIITFRFVKDAENWTNHLDAVIYLCTFFLITYLIFRQRLCSALVKQRRELLKPADLDAYSVTPAEKRVLEVLVRDKAADRDIADKLCISLGTVKTHVRSIKQKMRIPTRYGVIYACRNNFPGGRSIGEQRAPEYVSWVPKIQL